MERIRCWLLTGPAGEFLGKPGYPPRHPRGRRARAFGAVEVFAVDRRAEKLALAASYGAVPVDASRIDPVTEIQKATAGRGVDAALEVIGSNDHLLQELPQLLEMARRGILDTSRVVTRTIPLEASAINAALDALDRYEGGVRTVIVP